MLQSSHELPVSFNQEQTLLRFEMMRRTGVDTRGLADHRAVFLVRDSVDEEVLARALALLIDRHSALRSGLAFTTRYTEGHRRTYLNYFARHGVFVPGIFAQRVQARTAVELRARAIDSRLNWTDAIQQAILDDEADPLDLSRAPAIRVSLLRDHAVRAMIVASSHLTHDAISGDIMIAELERIYTALQSGAVPELRPAGSHVEFTAREHSGFAKGLYRAHEDFWWRCWVENRKAVVQAAELPFLNRTQRRIGFGKGASLSVTASVVDSEAVNIAARRSRITIYILFRTLMTVALYRFLGRETIAFWANFVNRHRESELRTVAWCATTHLVVTRLVPKGSFLDVVKNVSGATREALTHASIPLPAVWLRHGKDLTRGLGSRINFDATPAKAGALEERLFEQLHLPKAVRGVDLDIRVSSFPSISLMARFNDERYGTDGVQALLDGMMRAAVGFANKPDLTLDECCALFD